MSQALLMRDEGRRAGASLVTYKLLKHGNALLQLRDFGSDRIKAARSVRLAGLVCDEASSRAGGLDEPLLAQDAKAVLHGLSSDTESLRQLLVSGQLPARLEHFISDVLADRVGNLHGRQAGVIRVDAHARKRIQQLELERGPPKGL